MRKDAVITVRVPRPTRRRLETLAKREGRSLSQQVERLIERGLDDVEALTAGQALDRLQGSLGLTPRSAARWAAAARTERRERSRRHKTRGR